MHNIKRIDLSIDCGNDAFTHIEFEIVRILKDLCEKLNNNGLAPYNLKDINGNNVGTFDCTFND